MTGSRSTSAADHLVGQAARAQDDRGAELDHRDPRGAQHLAGFVPAAQVRRQPRAGLAQAPEVDDPPDARVARGRAEIRRPPPVLLLELSRRAHGVDEVVRRPHTRQRAIERCTVQDVALEYLGAGTDPPRQVLDAACEAAERNPLRFQRPEQPAAHIPRRAAQQNTHFGAHFSASMVLLPISRSVAAAALLAVAGPAIRAHGPGPRPGPGPFGTKSTPGSTTYS